MTRRRSAHGAARAGGATVVYETPPADELRPVPAGAADPIARREDGTFTPAGAAAAARRRADLAKLPDFAEGELEFIPETAFAPFDDARRELTRQSGLDLARSTGGLSRGVWTVVRGACWLTAFAEFWATVAAQTGDPDAAERASRFFQRASIERVKAEDLAAREALARQAAEGDDLARAQAEFQRGLAERVRADAERRALAPAAPSATQSKPEAADSSAAPPGASTEVQP